MKNIKALDKINSYFNPSVRVLLTLILISLIFVIFNSRQIFFFKYEPEYYENLYYHSQWNIPNSTRGISDGVLYQFVGYRLVQGENPFYLNFEAPPFGKYLYGLSEYFFGNPYWVSLGMYFGSIYILYLLSQIIFKDKKYSLVLLLLFVTTPFVATQLRETMLDLPVMFLFLANVYFFVKYIKKPDLKSLVLSGIFLGLATGTKIGVYTLGLIILSIPLMIWLRRSIMLPLVFLAGTGAGYLFSYISYFLKHPNPIPWIKLHQKQLDFYYNPDPHIDYLNQWRGIFVNSYEGWWNLGKTTFGDWSPLLPVGVIAAIVLFVIAIIKKDKVWVYLSGFTINFLIINSLISFWPRYLMPIIPVIILLVAYFCRKYWIILIVLVLLNLPFLYSSLAVKNYTASSAGIGDFVAKRAYRELYRSIDPEQRKSIPEEKFIRTLENFYQTLGVRKIETELKEINPAKDSINGVYQITYLTDYGKISFQPTLEYKDIHNQTRLVWKWDYLWPGYSPEEKLVVEKVNIEDAFYKNSGETYHKRGQAEFVYIITRHIKWADTLDELSKFVERKSSLDINDEMRWVVPDDFPRYVGIFNKGLGEEGRREVLNIKGVKMKEVDLDEGVNIYFESNGVKQYIIKTDGKTIGIFIKD